MPQSKKEKLPKLYKSLKKKYNFGSMLPIARGFNYYKTLVSLPPIGD